MRFVFSFLSLSFFLSAQPRQSLSQKNLEAYQNFQKNFRPFCESRLFHGSYQIQDSRDLSLQGSAEFFFECPFFMRFRVQSGALSFEFVTNSNEAWIFFPQEKNSRQVEYYPKVQQRTFFFLIELFQFSEQILSLRSLWLRDFFENFDLSFEKKQEGKVFRVFSKRKDFPSISFSYRKGKKGLPEKIQIEGATELNRFRSWIFHLEKEESVKETPIRLFHPDWMFKENVKIFR